MDHRYHAVSFKSKSNSAERHGRLQLFQEFRFAAVVWKIDSVEARAACGDFSTETGVRDGKQTILTNQIHIDKESTVCTYWARG
jgi:hypothetical protein